MDADNWSKEGDDRNKEAYANPPDDDRRHGDDEGDEIGADKEERIEGTLFSKQFVLITIERACHCQLAIFSGDSETGPTEIEETTERLAVLREMCSSESSALAHFAGEDQRLSPRIEFLAQALASLHTLPAAADFTRRLVNSLVSLAAHIPGELQLALTRLCLHVLRWMDADVLEAAFSALSKILELSVDWPMDQSDLYVDEPVLGPSREMELSHAHSARIGNSVESPQSLNLDTSFLDEPNSKETAEGVSALGSQAPAVLIVRAFAEDDSLIQIVEFVLCNSLRDGLRRRAWCLVWRLCYAAPTVQVASSQLRVLCDAIVAPSKSSPSDSALRELADVCAYIAGKFGAEAARPARNLPQHIRRRLTENAGFDEFSSD